MSKRLVLAEKPSVGRDIARVMNCKKKGNGYFESEKYIVTWALGHLVELASPERYEERYKSWRIEDLPILPNRFKLEIIKKTGKQFHTVKTQMNRKDVQEIIIATDAGREGELVARWIIDKAYVKKPIKRLWISSVTDKAIKEGFRHLKNGSQYENLYASAVARAEADWVVGLNASRALTCKYNAQLSCGRVQTPTLAMVQKREEEIRNFKAQKYNGITAMADGLKLTWHDRKSNNSRIFNEEKCNSILSSVQNSEVIVQEISRNHKKVYASKLYDLTELQREANKIFDFSPKETLSIMQRLYENHKVLTYPRTDSRYITTDIVETLRDRIKACGVGPYSQFAKILLKGNIKENKSFVDNSKVSDHHAIIPTEQSIWLEDLSDKERKIYDLVIKRFLAVLYPPFESEQISIKCTIGDEIFFAKGQKVIKDGWKIIYGYDKEYQDQQVMGNIKKGDKLKVTQIIKTDGMTTPPSPFNEGTLLSAMENPAKYLESDNKKWSKTLGETGGLGTVATRADILEKLFNSFLIEKKGKDIYITSKGKQLLNLVPEELKSPVLTAQWEQKLSNISKGNLNKNLFINDMKQYAKEAVLQIKNSDEKYKHDNMTKNKCPECGKYMLEVNNKTGKLLVCQDRECGHRKMIAKITNSRCPNCHKKLELRGEGEGRIFACSCGHREKLSAFNERKSKEKNQLSKKDVSKYLRQQNNKEPLNTALADALAKFKFNDN